MTTTSAMIVEMIIIGFQAVLWSVVVLAMVYGIDVLWLNDLGPLATPLAVALLPFCYSIGLVIDGFAAWAEDVVMSLRYWRHPEDRIEQSEIRIAKRQQHRTLRQWLRLSNRELYADLDQDAYLLRLIRATFFIAMFATLAIASALARVMLCQLGGDRGVAVGLLLFLAAVDLMCGIAWYRRRQNFDGNRKAFYEQLAARRATEEQASNRVKAG